MNSEGGPPAKVFRDFLTNATALFVHSKNQKKVTSPCLKRNKQSSSARRKTALKPNGRVKCRKGVSRRRNNTAALRGKSSSGADPAPSLSSQPGFQQIDILKEAYDREIGEGQSFQLDAISVADDDADTRGYGDDVTDGVPDADVSQQQTLCDKTQDTLETRNSILTEINPNTTGTESAELSFGPCLSSVCNASRSFGDGSQCEKETISENKCVEAVSSCFVKGQQHQAASFSCCVVRGCRWQSYQALQMCFPQIEQICASAAAATTPTVPFWRFRDLSFNFTDCIPDISHELGSCKQPALDSEDRWFHCGSPLFPETHQHPLSSDNDHNAAREPESDLEVSILRELQMSRCVGKPELPVLDVEHDMDLALPPFTSAFA